MKKRVGLLFLSIVLCLTVLPIGVFAATPEVSAPAVLHESIPGDSEDPSVVEEPEVTYPNGFNKVDGVWKYYKDNKFLMLHHFKKKSQKPPPVEIEKAKRELEDYIRRHKNNE